MERRVSILALVWVTSRDSKWWNVFARHFFLYSFERIVLDRFSAMRTITEGRGAGLLAPTQVHSLLLVNGETNWFERGGFVTTVTKWLMIDAQRVFELGVRTGLFRTCFLLRPHLHHAYVFSGSRLTSNGSLAAIRAVTSVVPML